MEVENKWGRKADESKVLQDGGADCSTKRHINEGAEKHLDIYYPVLDHGFIALVDYMGGDETIDRAARCSYGAGTRKRTEVAGLIDFLVRNRHTSPLEMAECTWHMRLPIFVARQLVRHRTANLNEYSGRYSEMLNMVYQPLSERLGKQSKTNKQGTDATPLSDVQKTFVLDTLKADTDKRHEHYETYLNDDIDLSRELARIGLGVNVYTEWYWKCDMKNTCHFLKLRNDDHAQWEIREYAKIMQDILTDAFPCLMESFSNHQQNSATLSLEELTLVRSIFNSDWAGTENPVFKIPDVSDREWTTEMLSKLHKVVGTITALRVDTARTKAKGKKVKEG